MCYLKAFEYFLRTILIFILNKYFENHSNTYSVPKSVCQFIRIQKNVFFIRVLYLFNTLDTFLKWVTIKM